MNRYQIKILYFTSSDKGYETHDQYKRFTVHADVMEIDPAGCYVFRSLDGSGGPMGRIVASYPINCTVISDISYEE